MSDFLTHEAVVQLLWTAAMILAFAGIGALRTYHSARTKGEQWEWGEGKAEILALGGAGALAGIYVFSVGGSPTDPVFGTAVTVAALMARKALRIHEDSSEHYDELTDAGVDPLDAAMLSIREGVKQNDPEEIQAGLADLLEQGGRPSREKAEENVAGTRERVESGDLDDLGLEPEALLQVDDGPDTELEEIDGQEGGVEREQTVAAAEGGSEVDGEEFPSA